MLRQAGRHRHTMTLVLRIHLFRLLQLTTRRRWGRTTHTTKQTPAMIPWKAMPGSLLSYRLKKMLELKAEVLFIPARRQTTTAEAPGRCPRRVISHHRVLRRPLNRSAAEAF
jgi:hypothetical protein